ncbi:RNA-directed DNA polymerase, eukaryota [Tanacetum coccineum]|uniref:RNA-directed DNA polymerase, eukaryota n=1 Tax=Tanacetum coccineum TaxID=301880 RepID=A0ABQ5D1K0_9ASTR
MTNFPRYCNSRELWKACSVYGTVVDVFIPSKKSKVGKRFAFVRFIKVFNIDRLVENLCTIWIGRYHLYANKVHFERPNKSHPFPDANNGAAKNYLQWNPSFELRAFKERVYNSEDESSHATPHLNEVESDNDNGTDDEEVADTIFGTNLASGSKLQLNVEGDNQMSDDPFEIYDILKKQNLGDNREPSPSLSHPPGFSMNRDTATNIEVSDGSVEKEQSTPLSAKVMNTSQEIPEGLNGDFVRQQNSTHNGGSVLGVLDDIIKVGQSMGYTMEGCAKDLENIIGIFSSYPSQPSAFMSDRHLSDHRPILLREVRLDFGPTPFRFYHSWLDMVGFDDMINSSWKSFSHTDENRLICFKKKLQELKVIIRSWTSEKKRASSCLKSDLTSELGKIDKDLESGSKEICKKSKLNGAVEGDEKFKFFFHDQLIELERYVSRDEIRLAVWNCGNNKSPGPDGFTFEFFKKYWDLIGTDFCDAVEFFFSNGFFPKGCNSSFIALIPKVVDAKFVKDFRPISLIGCVYKVVTKILANRLALVISDLVSDTQSAFIAGRQILDGPFILDEILKWCKRKKNKAMFYIKESIYCKRLRTVHVPKGVLKIMEAIRNRFFNGADISDRKITWAAWDKILASKKKWRIRPRIGNGSDTVLVWNVLEFPFEEVRDGNESQQMTELNSMLNMGFPYLSSRGSKRFEFDSEVEFRLCYIESVDGGIFPRTLGRLSWSGKAGLILSVSLPRPSPLKVANESPMFLERIQVKRVRLDNAGEFTSHAFNDYCMSVGIVVEHPIAHVHTQNVYVPIAPPQRTKMCPQRRLGIYVGYETSSIIRYIEPFTGDLFTSRFVDCHFDEAVFP